MRISWLHLLRRHLAARGRAWARSVSAQPAQSAARPARALFEELEPRLLYSADHPAAWLSGAVLPSAVVPSAVVQMVPAAQATPVQPFLAPPSAPQTVWLDAGAPAVQTLPDGLQALPPTGDTPPSATPPASPVPSAPQAPRHEIVFVDAAVPDAQALIDTLLAQRTANAEIEIVSIRSDADALLQIDAVLKGERELDAVHIISHGDSGRLWVGNGFIDASTLLARSSDFSAWHDALSPQADLLLWGCDVAAGPSGASFIAQLAQLTGADVAASTDATGHQALGGDWLLEASTGDVAAQAALGAAFQAQWMGLLPTYQQYSHYTAGSEVKSNAEWGQTFTHISGGGTYNVNQVSLALRRDVGAPAQTITVELRSSWNGAVLGSATIASASLGTSFSFVDLGFTGVALTDGATYTLRVRSDSVAGAVYVGTNPAGGYAGGTKLDNSGAALVGEDLAFKVAATQAVAVDASSSVATDGVASVNLAHTTSGSNRLMLVTVATDPHGDRASAVTYNGVNLSLVGVEEFAGQHSRVEIWSLVAPSSGAHNVVVTMTGTNYNGLAVGVTTYTGVNQAAPLLDFNSASGSSTAAAVTVTSALNDLVFAAVHSHNGGGVVPGAGQTEYWDVFSGQSNGAASGQPGAGSVTSSWTVVNDDWSAAAVAVQAVDHSTATLSTTAVKDAYIRQSSPTSNQGLLGSMVVDRETGDLQRALVQFDLSAIPANAVVVSAALKLEASAIGGALNTSAYQLQQSWTETGVTWNESSSGVNWSVAGGAYNAVALDTVSTGAAGQHRWDATSLAQAWVAGTQPNHGLMVASPDGGGDRRATYMSREGAAGPVFEIVYIVPNTAPGATNLSSAEGYTEDTALNLTDIVITDPDSANTISATLTLSDSAAGSLNTGTSGAVSSTFNAGTGVWSASGPLADVNSLLATLTFTPAPHHNSNFSIATSVSDGEALAVTGSKAMTGSAVNDAPVLDNTGTMTLPSLTKIQINNGGSAVASIIASAGGDRVTDVDGGAEGIAVTALVNGNGSWEYSTNGGASFSAIGAVSGTSALLLRDIDLVRLVPNGISGTTASFDFQAWDQSSGSAGSKVSVAASGGATAFSSATETAGIVVDDVNAAPVLDNSKSPALAATAEDAGAPVGAVGTLVRALVDFASPAGQVDNVTDVDAGAGLGIAVTAADTSNGSWYYSIDNGATWNALGAVSDANARLLAADVSTRLYFQPAANYFGSLAGAITFRAWDQNSGGNGGTAMATGTHTLLDEFSTAAYTNNNGTRMWGSNWIEVGDNNGATGGGIKVSSSNELQVTAQTAADHIYRGADLSAASSATLSFAYNSTLTGARAVELQVSANGGAAYTTLSTFNASTNTGSGTRSYDIGAYMASNTRIRIIVAAGGSATESVSFDNVQIQYTSAGGGTTALSMATDTASLAVNPVVDTPSVSNATTNEDTRSAGGLVISRHAADGLEVTHFKITGITNGTLYQNDGTTPITNGSFITFAQGNAGLKFTPTPDFNGSGSFTVQASLSAGDGGLGGGSVNATVTVNAVNDPPTVSTSGGTLTLAENDAATPVDAGLVVTDADGALTGATVSIATGYVQGEDLLLFTNQLSIIGSWNAGSGVLTLSGNTTVANYQAALRAVSYLNNSEAPDTVLRTVAFDVSDGVLTSAQATRDMQMMAVNDAPVLDNSGAMLLTTIGRTNNASPGNTVAQVIASVGGDRITDVDVAALEGVALTATTSGGLGLWQYSLDGGGSWTAVGVVNTNAALLMRDTDRVRFVPSGAANGQATLTFRAWDQSSGTAGSLADASSGGGSQPYSAVFESAAVNVVENTSGAVAVGDSAQTQAGVVVPVSVLANDLDPQGDPLTVLDVSNPANGTVALGGAGSVTYTPNGGFSGSDSFNYVITDGNEGLTNYWKLDGNGTDSVGGSHGTLMNGPTSVPGAFGQALLFDGVDDHVTLPDLGYSNEFSLSFRFRVDDNSGNQIQYFYSHGATPSTGQRNMVHVGLVEAGNATVAQRNQMITTVFDGNDAVDGAGQLLVDVAALIGDGQWHQYTATVTPGIGTRVYIDGTLRGSVNRGGDAINPSGSAYLGARSDLEPTRYLNAGSRMDSAALFNRALSASEVGDYWTGGSRQAAVTVDVNDAPVLVTSGGSASYTEDAVASTVDGGLALSDANSAALVGASVSISSNYTPGQDQLQFSNQLGISGNWNPGTGELALSGSASVADYQTALRSVSFINHSDNPVATPRVLSFVVHDGQVPSATATRNLTVTPVNDAPSASGLNMAETYTEDTALNLADIVVSDVDHAAGSATLTLSSAAAGALSTGTSGAVSSTYNAGTGVWSANGALADVNVLLAGVSFSPALNFSGGFSIATQVSDGVAAPLTGSKVFTGVALNDAPTATNPNAAENYTEDTPLNLIDIVVSDVDSANVTATLTLSDAAAGALSTGTSGAVTSSYDTGSGVWTASGAVADVNALLAGLVFTPALDYTAAFSIGTSVSDGVAAAVTGSKAFVATLVNDAPTATNLNAAETYTEDTPLNLTDIVVGDVDSAAITATLTLSNAAAGALSTATSGAVTSTYNAGTGVWTASGALADVNLLLAGLSFMPALNFSGGFSIATQVSDGVAAPLTGSKVFTGVAVNDAPSASNLNAAETYTEDALLNLADIVVSDVDGSSGSVTLTLSDPAVGLLGTGTSGSVSSSYNPATGVWTASGAWADINVLLAALSFTPMPDFNGPFSIATSVSDGVAAPVTGNKVFTGLPANDAPTATNLTAAEGYTEDQALDLTDIVISDSDSANVTATLTLSNPAAGTLSAGVSGTVTATFNALAGVWTASGALADVNALLAAVAFNPARDFNADFSIVTAADDGVAAAVTGVKLITGVPVNDAPTAAGLDNAEVYTEDVVLDLSNLVVADVDSAALTVTLTLSDAASGALSTPISGAVTAVFNAVTGVWSAGGALDDVNAVLAAVQFTPAQNFHGGFSVATSVSDGVAAPLAGTKVFSGLAVNDAPVLAFTGSLALAEGSTSTLGAAQLQATDEDNVAAQLVYTVLAAPAHGAVLLGGVALGGGGTFTQADVDAGRVTYRHDSSETMADLLEFSLGDGQALGATGQLPITVLPVNDEVPRFTSPALAATLSVPENQIAVTRVAAADADLPAQSLSFAIAGGADAVHFSIDSNTGDLQFIQAPDHERPQDLDGDNVYHVDLRVTDGSLSSTHSVIVAVLPENDNTPKITSSSGSAQAVLEVQEGDRAVVTLTATDADRPAPALTYSVVGGADAARFVVDAASGALRFVDAPRAINPRDADRNNVYEVVVQASDGTLLVQQALRVQVRAALAAGPPSAPPSTDAPPAPAPYLGTDAPAEVVTSSPLVLKDPLLPSGTEELDEAASWTESTPGRRTSIVRQGDRTSSRSADGALPATPTQQLAAEAAAALAAAAGGSGESWMTSHDTQSLEAALGLPSTEPEMLQIRPGGLSLAALASQTATRSTTAVPGQLAPMMPTGDEGRSAEDSDSLVEALATPVVAGGLAFSATLLVWATRAGGLVAAMMASVPAWRSLDPLPILERTDKPDEDQAADDIAALTGAGLPASQAALEEDHAAAGAPPPSAQRPGALRDLIEPMEMLR